MLSERHATISDMPEAHNKNPKCAFCCGEMRRFRSNKSWIFFRCEKDGYWTARDSSGQWPSMKYSDTPDFQVGQECEWSKIVTQTSAIMRHKFNLAGMQKGKFLDIGCSEGTYVAGCAELGWIAAGIEIDDAKLSRARSRGLDVRSIDISSKEASMLRADFVMLRHVLEHVPDFVKLAMTAASAVTVGGVLWIECPNQAGLSVLSKRNRVREERYLGALYPPSHIHAFEPKAFRQLGEIIGLNCEKIITYAPSDPNWCPPYQVALSQFKGKLHKVAALLGYGDSLAVIYRKNI
jgi:SAM-dependent methyltransferase